MSVRVAVFFRITVGRKSNVVSTKTVDIHLEMWYSVNIMKYTIDGAELEKIKVMRSIRLSLRELKDIERLGMTVTEAVRKGLGLVLGDNAPMTQAAIERESRENALWFTHSPYLDGAESVEQLDRAWEDFEVAMLNEGGLIDPAWIDYYHELRGKLEASE